MSKLHPDQSAVECFLHACLISRWSPEKLNTAAEACRAPRFDWDAVRNLAHEERVAPLLYLAVRDVSIVPEALLQDLHGAYFNTALENTLRLEEFSSIATYLTDRSVPIMALKGLSLLEPIYGNLALRPMVDLDILVHRSDVQNALILLEDLGYEPIGPELAPEATLAFENELLLRKIDGIEWHVELHWSLFDSPYYQRVIPEHDVWNAMQVAAINGRACNILSTEHQVLHLSGHLMLHHGGDGLLWWNDIAELLHHKGKSLDWDRLVDLAGAYDLRLSTKAVLFLLSGEWGVPIPFDTLEELAAAVPTIGQRETFRRLTAMGRLPTERLLDDLAGLDSWTDRATFMRHNLFPSTTYMDVRYSIRSPLLRPFYYVRRWLYGAVSILGTTTTASPVPTESQTPRGGDRG